MDIIAFFFNNFLDIHYIDLPRVWLLIIQPNPIHGTRYTGESRAA